MKEERMFILTMVNEGKISASEGVELLNALAATENSLDGFARGVKDKTADLADRAKPKVKKAATSIKNKSVEVFDSLKGKFNDKFCQGESAAAKEDDKFDSEYVDITASVDEDFDERTQRDPEMARDEDTLPVEEDE